MEKSHFLIDRIQKDWYKYDSSLCEGALNMDLACAIVRMCPTKLFHVDQSPIQCPDRQKKPSWGAFNAKVSQNTPLISQIGYCLMTSGSPTEYNTVYTVMKQVQVVMAALGQKDCVITFDLAIYVKAKEMQWRREEEFKDTVIRMGGFHIAQNYLALIGKCFEESGLEDLLIESNNYGSPAVSSLLKGKSYNRGVRAHKLVMEAMVRLQWQEFSSWLQQNRSKYKVTKHQEAQLSELAKSCRDSADCDELLQQRFSEMCKKNGRSSFK